MPFALSLSKGECTKTNQKEGDPGLPPLRGSLDQPQASGAAQLALAGRTPRAPLRSSNSARLNLRSLAADRGNPAGAANRGRLLLVTFLGKTRKVTSCRATPGGVVFGSFMFR